jgi:pyruvate dehydrogenase E2 component (dihydrolipoamide acetyltransferase)
MAYEFKLPDLGEGVAEGEVARWLVEVGQSVEEDDPLVEIQTDKATVEIPSPAAGRVARILVEPGELVPVGTPLVVIGDEEAGRAEAGDGAADGAEVAERGVSRGQTPGRGQEGRERRVQATPLVRKIAAELGVDLGSLIGTGPGGRISEEDVRAAAQAVSRGQTPGHVPADASDVRRVPLRGVRRRIAHHLAESHREVAAVTVVEECDFTELDGIRGERSYLTYVLRAAVSGLRAFPELNATLDGEEIVLWERYDVGIAVQTDEGLIVPVLRGADQKSLDELGAEAARLAEGARAGTLAPEELRGSTFTVTSAGRLGGLFATPLVNYPEVAILGVHRIADRPAARDGEVVVRRMGLLSCTFDHRVVDGARASEFLVRVIEALEAPAS